jgi:predicted alpha/beta superfamily hydrolase
MPVFRLFCAAALFSLSLACQAGASTPEPLAIGQTFTIDSAQVKEARRINVYIPPGFAGQALPVMYMPDGGLGEDFLHVAGLLQVGAGNGTMRPFILVGIENTERRRDLTGPTTDPEDRKIAPRVGGSLAFRAFIRTELMPEIARRYRVTGETAIVGESLAGLFVVETLLTEPDLFDTYIAIDPSLWWNKGALVQRALPAIKGGKALYLSTSGQAQIGAQVTALAARLKTGAPALHWRREEMPAETHATIYHPAALKAFRAAFKPAALP